MKLVQSTLQRNFTVKHNGKCYYIEYINSDGQILGLLNRNYWEIWDEDSEEIQIYEFQEDSKKEKIQIKKNKILAKKLIKFCTKHFNDYKSF